MEISLEGKRAFISGAANGIGRATAVSMHKLGAEVMICDIDEENFSSFENDIKTFVCDVSDSSVVDQMFDQISEVGLDILVNNAGIAGPTKLVENITDQEWRECMAVCIDSQFYCTRRAVPIFKQQQQGVIINLISGAGIMGYPTRSPYVAAKWAVTGLTKSLAMELGPDNIRVNGIVPGNVSGDRVERVIYAHAEAENLEPETVRKMYKIGTSMQCFVEPEEIAEMICFLSSDYGKHISGQIVGIDGNTETLYPRSLIS
ncbi:MAG: 3-oxoacyl-[acyl-carrier-protein] reductase FabG [Deltaproteobacteria bacterium]|jgi:NAD(P)-dependent dehydrogenase (short-subunit alcohol dehydrogenase family)|nr:3-oxoacyl-[acyl-carrier-protein] reductase FabG [Deltaproteobacteria bacterium]